MNFKNSKPKPYKGCCWMCAKGDRRCHRTPTLQERRAGSLDETIASHLRPGVTIEDEAVRPATYYDEVVEDDGFAMEDEIDRFMGLYPGTSVEIRRVPSPRVPVISRPLVFA